MNSTRRTTLLGLAAIGAACASTTDTPDPIVGHWRDARYRDSYEFLSDGRGRFELYVPPDEDPMLSAVLTPQVSWRRVRAGYEITLQTLGLDGGYIVRRGIARLDGDRIASDIRQREGTLTLVRVP